MLKQIAEISSELVQFVNRLNLPLNKPQLRHVLQIADGLITVEGRKTLSALYRAIVGKLCAKSAADTFRLGAWEANDIRLPLRHFLVKTALELAARYDWEKVIYLSVDDSLTERDRHSKRLQWLDWMIDLKRSFPGKKPVFTKGAVYVLLRLHVGPISFTIDIRPYLREKTVRRLNRRRPKGQKLTYLSKIKLTRQMLRDIEPLLPKDYRVYLLMDSWYAAQSILRWCFNRHWHVICRLKSNRALNGMQVRHHNQRLKHTHYKYVIVEAAASQPPKTYLLRSIVGRLSGLKDDGRVWISKRHPKDTRPRYFFCSDLSLSATQALTIYHKRWGCEVVNWYLTQLLGWADCRLWHVEAAEKFMMVLWVALAFLEYQQATLYPHLSLADIARQHRHEHAKHVLQQACELALDTGDIQLVLTTFTLPALVPS